ncbi:MAG: YceI family protein [Verrucomicrobia bacterium]|nr:YceI family protein [Verrucomicrobiota bacterium]
MNRHRSRLAFAALAAGLVSSASAAVETYTIDPVHSAVGFSIRHFVSKVPGKFTKFGGTITVDRENLQNSSAEATIDVTSVNTDNQKRDAHLRSADFFEVEKFPTMTFKSTSWKKTGAETFQVTGDLTLKGVTKPVVLKVALLGFGPGMRGAMLSGWEATTTINKAEFNVKDPPMLDAALGDDVTITINIEAGMKKT